MLPKPTPCPAMHQIKRTGLHIIRLWIKILREGRASWACWGSGVGKVLILFFPNSSTDVRYDIAGSMHADKFGDGIEWAVER